MFKVIIRDTNYIQTAVYTFANQLYLANFLDSFPSIKHFTYTIERVS